MKSGTETSMLWRTTRVVGMLAFASMLGYVAVTAASDPAHGPVFRMVAAAALIALVCVGVMAALRGRREHAS
jgi:hypothetical protein